MISTSQSGMWIEKNREQNLDVIENRISSNEVNCDMISTSQNQIFEENNIPDYKTSNQSKIKWIFAW